MTKLTDARRHRAELAEASKFKEMFNKCRAALDDTEIDLAKALAEIERLREIIREYLGEYDTPAKDFGYRASCREKLRRAALARPQQRGHDAAEARPGRAPNGPL